MDTDARPVVDLREIHKSFGDHEVLKGVDLDVARRGVRGHLRPLGLGQEHATAVH